MKIRTALFAMTALALIPGCSKGGANNAATANAPAAAGPVNEAEAAPANEAAAMRRTKWCETVIGGYSLSVQTPWCAIDR